MRGGLGMGIATAGKLPALELQEIDPNYVADKI